MLTARELELLTAAVDGALAPAQSRTFRSLLAAKSEATALFRALQTDAAKVRATVPSPIPVSQVGAVLARIGAKARPRPARSAPSRRGLLLQYAVAASVFFTLCSASFWIFTARDRHERDRVQVDLLPVAHPASDAPVQNSVAVAQSIPKAKSVPPAEVVESIPKTDVVAIKPVEIELAPSPRSAIGDVVGSGIIENPKPLTEVRLRLPFLFEASEFDALDVQARLKLDLAQDPAYRLDLFTKNTVAALELLQSAAKQAGVNVSIDAKTQELLNRKVPVSVAFYLEGLTAAELGQLFSALGKHLQTAPKPLPLGKAHLLPAGSTDLRDLKELLGVDLVPARSPRNGGEPKSISADTLGKVTNSVKKVGDKAAIVVAYLPANARTAPAQSKEIKAFLDKRGERKPGTVPLLIVLRPQG